MVSMSTRAGFELVRVGNSEQYSGAKNRKLTTKNPRYFKQALYQRSPQKANRAGLIFF